jgi:hypothetical protein
MPTRSNINDADNKILSQTERQSNHQEHYVRNASNGRSTDWFGSDDTNKSGQFH